MVAILIGLASFMEEAMAGSTINCTGGYSYPEMMRMVFGCMMKMKVGSLLEETYTHCFSGGGQIHGFMICPPIIREGFGITKVSPF